jgi:hypothetical protein
MIPGGMMALAAMAAAHHRHDRVCHFVKGVSRHDDQPSFELLVDWDRMRLVVDLQANVAHPVEIEPRLV